MYIRPLKWSIIVYDRLKYRASPFPAIMSFSAFIETRRHGHAPAVARKV